MRYPSEVEKKKGYESLKEIIKSTNPSKVFLFGKDVQEMFQKEEEGLNTHLYFCEHPSYISVYKKGEISNYKTKILNKIKS